METLGKHLIIELWGCNPKTLDNKDYLEDILVKAALKAKATVCDVCLHQFTPIGVSGVVVISESHISIHTFPEHGYASADIYTCGNKMNPLFAVDHLSDKLQAQKCDLQEIARGKKPIFND